MVKLREKGLVKKIGYSIYSPAELDSLFSTYQPDIVQAPMNIIDRRIQTSGWLRKLYSNNVEVHARSCFLQGLLLMPPAERPQQFMRFNKLWQLMDRWLVAENLSALSACMQFMYAVPEVDKVVVGVNSPDQFREILAVGPDNRINFPEEFSSEDPELIDPSLWTRQ
jgi:aryl-alcohol dehydrogenase-like predicted oxidoreductase